MSRRGLLAAAPALAALPAVAATPSSDLAALPKLAADARPISVEERLARIARVQGLMQKAGVGALLVEAGTSLDYFTGIRWWRSERTTAAIIPAEGGIVVVTPAFEEPSVRETLVVPGEVRPWNEHESPFERLAQALKDRKVVGDVAVEPTTRFFVLDGVARASGLRIVSGDALVRACRLIKSPAEIALLQTANAITLEAIRHARGRLQSGMTSADIGALVDNASAAMGASPDGALVLLNEASAYPHGSHQKQVVREGSVVLMDCGCSVHGYTSDISRTMIFGAPTPRQRKVWETVKRGQEIALEAARPGVPVGSIDDAVRAYYEAQGWGPAYRLPGLPHRTGHGIGMDGHEAPFLVHGDATPLAAGMCFSDEPGLYMPGEFGIRLEDCWRMTEAGPKTFTPLARSIDDPI